MGNFINQNPPLMQGIHSPTVAHLVALTTTGMGIGALMEFIPHNLGELATSVGIMLSVVLITVHVLAAKKTMLEIACLKRREDRRAQMEADRRAKKLPVRRSSD